MHNFGSVLVIAHEKLLVEMRSRMTLSPFEEDSKLLLSDVQRYINSTGCSLIIPWLQILGATQVTQSWDAVSVKAVLLSFYLGYGMICQDFHPILSRNSNFAPLCPERLTEVLLTPSGSANAL